MLGGHCRRPHDRYLPGPGTNAGQTRPGTHIAKKCVSVSRVPSCPDIVSGAKAGKWRKPEPAGFSVLDRVMKQMLKGLRHN